MSAGVINPLTRSWVTTGSAACGAPATPAQCNAINALLPRFFGLIPRTDDNDLGFGRLDYHASDQNTFTAEFNFLRWWSPNGIQTGLELDRGRGHHRQRRRFGACAQWQTRLDFRSHQQLREHLPFRLGYRPAGRLVRPGGIGRAVWATWTFPWMASSLGPPPTCRAWSLPKPAMNCRTTPTW